MDNLYDRSSFTVPVFLKVASLKENFELVFAVTRRLFFTLFILQETRFISSSDIRQAYCHRQDKDRSGFLSFPYILFARRHDSNSRSRRNDFFYDQSAVVPFGVLLFGFEHNSFAMLIRAH
jgi:hypothetical protein